MKKPPHKPGAKPFGRSERPAFGKPFRGKGASTAHGEPKPHGAGGGFNKKPRRFERGEDGAAAPSSEGFKKRAPARFGEKPAFAKRDDHRKPSGSFEKRPRRFERGEDGAAAPSSDGFKKRAPARFGEKPAFAKRDDHRKPSGSFEKRPRRFVRDGEDAPREEKRASSYPKPSYQKKRPAERAGAPAFGSREKFEKHETRAPRAALPKRESLNRQGVLLWGLHAVREAWLNPARHCYRLWTTDSGQAAMKEALDEAAAKNLPRPAPLRAEKVDIEHILPKASVHQGVALEVEPLKELTLDDLLGQNECPTLVVVLDQVTDPHNVGAILRSAAALGAGAVIVTERNAPATTGIMAKTASGATEHVPLIAVVNIARALETLKNESFWCVGLAEEGEKDMSASKLADGRVALVMGAEGEGLRRLTREHCDELARLPTSGAIASLNVSAAAAIALYEVKRQRG